MMRVLSVLLLILAVPAAAQKRAVPYWASIRASEVNMRVGPSADYKIRWVYQRAGLPVKVLRMMEGWRLIEDPDGERGWVVSRLLDPQQTAIVTPGEPVAMRASPEPAAALRWRAEAGVSGRVEGCEDGWCRIDVDGRDGWVQANRLWGVGEP